MIMDGEKINHVRKKVINYEKYFKENINRRDD